MYLPISRKYRPQAFDEIVGQEHITTTLKNAIAMNKVAHAYLFAGSRGIGKTSTARVFAKALNCEKGPTVNPCNKCTACQEISKGISLDVLEIDGASNRGIDEIRNLRENVKFKPVSGKYKIYIIDEVHMLTPEAFNALLKTLEEPPSHVKFIFATTRAYKILPTIVSRCQRFDFHIIPMSIIVKNLKEIAKEEKLDIQEDALFLLAKNADGSMRDGQVMLDQLASYAKDKIKVQDIAKILGILDQEILIKISEAILNKDSSLILDLVDNMINSGKDATFIATSLIGHFRNLLVVSSCKGSSEHVVLNESDKAQMEELIRRFSREELFYITYTLSNALDLIAKTSLGKIPLEIALLKLSQRDKLVPIAELVKRLEKIEGYPPPSQSLTHKMETIPVKPIPQRPTPEIVSPKVASSPDALFLRLKGIWPEIMRAVKTKKMSVGSYLEEGYLLELKENKVIVGFSKANSLHKEALESNHNPQVIEQVLKDFTEKDLKINFVFSETMVENNEKPITDNKSDDNVVMPRSKKVEPIVRAAIDKFEGKIIKQYYVKE